MSPDVSEQSDTSTLAVKSPSKRSFANLPIYEYHRNSAIPIIAIAEGMILQHYCVTDTKSSIGTNPQKQYSKFIKSLQPIVDEISPNLNIGTKTAQKGLGVGTLPERDKAEVLKEQLGLNELQVPCSVDEEIEFILDNITLKAANIVTSVLHDKITKGLPVKYIHVKLFVDYDAGQWEELVFNIEVDMASKDANREWDSILDEIAKIAGNRDDTSLVESLQEKIGIHFKWIVRDHV